MADNRDLASLAGNCAADELSYSGDTAVVQLMRQVHVTGAEGSKTLVEVFDYSNHHLVAAGSDNAGNIKASAGRIYTINAYNNAAAPRYVKFHNTAGSPTAGVGVVYTVAIQAGTARTIEFPHGLFFATGIGITIVTGIADNSTAAVTAADVVVDVSYK